MIKKILNPIISTLFDDKTDRYLLISTVIFYSINFFLWSRFIENKSIVFFWRTNIHPITFLTVIVLLNTLLTIAAHDKEKEVGYLLFMGNIIVCFLVFVLEIYYILI